jgi:ATP-binding cassette subfamily G (WHITE) protein 2
VISDKFHKATQFLVIGTRILLQEYVSGYYSMTALFSAKLVCDLLPMRVVPSLLFCSICYFMIGFQQTASHFFVFLLTIFMANVFGSATCFFVAASIPIYGKTSLTVK